MYIKYIELLMKPSMDNPECLVFRLVSSNKATKIKKVDQSSRFDWSRPQH